MKTLNWIAVVLVIVGAVNWGLIALLNINLVEMLVGTMPQVVKLVYILVGLSGLYMIKLAKKAV